MGVFSIATQTLNPPKSLRSVVYEPAKWRIYHLTNCHSHNMAYSRLWDGIPELTRLAKIDEKSVNVMVSYPALLVCACAHYCAILPPMRHTINPHQ